MVNDDRPDNGNELSWLLKGLADRAPHTRSVVLLSADGIPTAVHGLDRDRADQLAAIASGLFSLARTAAAGFADSDGVSQVVAELDGSLLFVSSAGFGSVLAVLAGKEADARLMGYEMTQLVKSVRPFLATPARQPDARNRGGVSARG